MTNTDELKERLGVIVRAVYLYGYSRAKKGMTRRDGYTDDEVSNLLALIQEEVTKGRLEMIKAIPPEEELLIYDGFLNEREHEIMVRGYNLAITATKEALQSLQEKV